MSAVPSVSSDEKRIAEAPVIGASLWPPSMRRRTSDDVVEPSTWRYSVLPDSTAREIFTPVPLPADGSTSSCALASV